MLKIQGVSAPIVGTTSLENLYDLLGMVYFFFLMTRVGRVIFSIGAIDVKLTEEEKKELEEPYMAQAINGHF